ncbi:NAD(P)-dependent oxidoreductase [Bacillus ndiopicus]|uniref:NAD(P)-dependent oxidoreductase n=1 Tax=Bacillus ndiopicus TaxID=1347368 RepID=UPI002DDB0B1B|nr:NAD(P)H-binding protein [Bacillus ndiopicus]
MLMKIAVIGAAGQAGSNILRESIMREYDTTAIVRNQATLKEDVKTLEKDLFDLTTADIEEFDCIVNAFAPKSGEEHLYVEAGKHLITILQPTKTRLIDIGSSGCLFTNKEKTLRLLDSKEYPAQLTAAAKYQLQNLQQLQQSSIAWTFICPALMFDAEGPRTGHYITGHDYLLMNSQHNSYISQADFAVVIIDEIENAKHINEAFTVASENTTSAS